MKFTKEEACKDLMSKIPSTGETLQLSERSINAQVETLLPLLANDETELADFVSQVLPIFKTADANIRGDVSAQVREYKEKNPVQKPVPPVEQPKEDNEISKLLDRISALEQKNADNEKAVVLATRKRQVSEKLEEKGCNDKEWIDNLLAEVNLEGEEFDAEARAERYIKMYNKKEAQTPKDTTPKTPKGGDVDSYVKSVIAAAAAKNKEAVVE
jgi:ABC-type Fe3+-hydroxamate transport system substrate-binding protein